MAKLKLLADPMHTEDLVCSSMVGQHQVLNFHASYPLTDAHKAVIGQIWVGDALEMG